MAKQKEISTLVGIIFIIISVAIFFSGAFIYQYFAMQKFQQTNVIPPPSETAGWKMYKNTEYGFQLTFPDSWKGYTIENQVWQGNSVDNFSQKYSGPEITIKNPQTTATQVYQDIPIMVFTPDQWQLVLQERVAVSAAPIGPAEIGHNTRYVFATPPRWYGFTDAIGFQEAVEIVKTFKAITSKSF